VSESLQDAALGYARRGWPVFPCKPRGKSPLTKHGFKDATTNEDKIRAWWSREPYANIGIPAGRAFVVVDIDPRHGGEDSLSQYTDLPETVISLTGGGGQHLLYRVPADHKFPNSAGQLAPGIDTRGEGGYIIAPPSIHDSGKSYEWELSSHPDEVELSELPACFSFKPDAEVFFDATKVKGAEPTEILLQGVKDGGRNNALVRLVGYWLAQGYVISDILLKAHAWNAKNVPPMPDAEVDKTAAKIVERDQSTPSLLTTPPAPTQPTPPKPPANKNDHAAQPMPDELLNPPGFVGTLMDWMLHTASHPQPVLALANSLSFFGAVIGRKVRTDGDMRSNLYALGVGESGCGKDHSRRVVKRVCMDAGIVETMLGGEEIASGQGVLSAVSAKNSVLFQLDEIGHLLSACTDSRSPSYLKAIPTMLTKMFSSASTIYIGTEYADKREKPLQTVTQPNVCLYGTTVPSKLYSSISESEIRDGFLGRILVFQSTTPDPDPVAPKLDPVPPGIREMCQYWIQKETIKPDGDLADLTEHIPLTIETQPGAKEVLDAFRDRCRGLKNAARDGTGFDSLWARAYEHAYKISLIIACGAPIGTVPVINRECAEYSCKLVEFLTVQLVRVARDQVADTAFGREAISLLNVIREAGHQGLTNSQLCRKIRGMKPRDRNDILQTLLDAGYIERAQRDSKSGPPSQYWYAV